MVHFHKSESYMLFHVTQTPKYLKTKEKDRKREKEERESGNRVSKREQKKQSPYLYGISDRLM